MICKCGDFVDDPLLEAIQLTNIRFKLLFNNNTNNNTNNNNNNKRSVRKGCTKGR